MRGVRFCFATRKARLRKQRDKKKKRKRTPLTCRRSVDIDYRLINRFWNIPGDMTTTESNVISKDERMRLIRIL